MTGLLQRRLSAEWDLLRELAARNPGRLTGLSATDTTFRGTLHGAACLPVIPVSGSEAAGASDVPDAHRFRISFPIHFPAVPMELYLDTPVQHPNIHPETGFVCLWERHRVAYTSETAIHRLAAMLAGRLFNRDAVHVIQPDALALMRDPGTAEPEDRSVLTGVEHSASDVLAPPGSGRRRLS